MAGIFRLDPTQLNWCSSFIKENFDQLVGTDNLEGYKAKIGRSTSINYRSLYKLIIHAVLSRSAPRISHFLLDEAAKVDMKPDEFRVRYGTLLEMGGENNYGLTPTKIGWKSADPVSLLTEILLGWDVPGSATMAQLLVNYGATISWDGGYGGNLLWYLFTVLQNVEVGAVIFLLRRLPPEMISRRYWGDRSHDLANPIEMVEERLTKHNYIHRTDDLTIYRLLCGCAIGPVPEEEERLPLLVVTPEDVEKARCTVYFSWGLTQRLLESLR